MYKTPKFHRTKITVNTSVEGETLETKIERYLANGDPISDTTELIYTERKDGVLAAYDIRTDRMEIAQDAMTIADKSYKARRQDRIKNSDKPDAEIGKKDGQPESTGSTGEDQ